MGIHGKKRGRRNASAPTPAPSSAPSGRHGKSAGEPPHRIHDVRVDMTMLAGNIMFAREGAGR